MKRTLISAVSLLSLTACTPDKKAEPVPVPAKEQTVFIVECDGLVSNTYAPEPKPEVTTYKIDVLNKTVLAWRAGEAKWADEEPGTRTLQATPGQFLYNQTDNQFETKGTMINRIMSFNRQTGALTSTIMYADANTLSKLDIKYEATCKKVDAPSTKMAF